MDSEDIENFYDDFEYDDIVEMPQQLATDENIDQSYITCLKKVFGHSNFRAMQWKIISSVMNEKRDNFTVMATGYGKSLCYQFPSVYLNTITIVVSPLISLMEDQVLSLKMSNIKACLLGTAQKDKSVINEVFNFEYNLVYVTPELLTSDTGSELLQKVSSRLTLIAIDEAHCISEWGHDFRSAFRLLGILRQKLPKVPILAMTATATEKVRKDIIKSLNLRNPQELCTGFDRPNLEFHVQQKSKFGVWSDLSVVIKSVRIGSIIVYCLTRAVTEEISEILNCHNVESTAYHAGLSLTERKRVHEEFVRDKIQVIVATVAFGMGIDKPDVRMVIHYGASKDLESYYQEVGRAGRDGMPAKCVMFYSDSDWRIHDVLGAGTKGSENMKIYRKEQALKIKEYVGILTCRRIFIISYFEGSSANVAKSTSNCCDNCKNNLSKKDEKLSDKYEELNDAGLFDFTKDAENYFRAIEAFNGNKGLSAILMLLRGYRRQTLNEKYYSHALFGIGKNRSEIWWKSFAILMEINHYTTKKKVEPFRGTKNKFQQFMLTIVLTNKATSWLQNPNREKILLQPDKVMYKFLKQKQTPFLSSGGSTNNAILNTNTSKIMNLEPKQPTDIVSVLFKALMSLRSNIAKTFDCMPYMIISNKALHQLAQKRPNTLEDIKNAKLDGLSDIKIMKFGPAFINTIAQYTQKEQNDANDGDKTLKEHLIECPLLYAKPITETLTRTYELFAAGKTIEEIAKIRNIAESTTYSYMSELIKNGFISTRKELRKLGVNDYYYNMISCVFPSNLALATLKDIKNNCPSSITYDMIKLVLSYFQLKEHCIKNNIPFSDSTDVSKQNHTDINEQSNNNKSTVQAQNQINNEPTKNLNTAAVENALWDLNDDDNDEIDFGYLDSQVEIFNNSNITLDSLSSGVQASQSSQSGENDNKILTEKNTSQENSQYQHKTIYGNNDKELDLLIDVIQNDVKKFTGKSQDNAMKIEMKEEEKLKSTKRKINMNQKNDVVYLDGSSSDDDDAHSHESLNDVPKKKKYPSWLSNLK